MSEIIHIENHGPLIRSTNYWSSELAAAGYFYLSPNSGTFRLLVPRAHREAVAEIRTAKNIVLTLGLHSAYGREMWELLFDDRTPSPYVLYLSPEQWERHPASTDFGLGFEFTAWEDRRGTPHKIISRPAWLRRAALPCLKPWA
jgi:hypothetical protein